MPMSRWIAWLKRRTPSAATRLPLGCGLTTTVLPPAIMLTALPVIVGSEWVTGVIAPMTPKGACSITARPWSPLKTSLVRNSTPGERSPSTFNFSILCSSRPIFVSSNSIRPSSTESSIEMRRMWAIALRRPSSPSFSSCSKASCEARTASSTLAKMPCRPANETGATGLKRCVGAPAALAPRSSAITCWTMARMSWGVLMVAWDMGSFSFRVQYGKRRCDPRSARCRPDR